MPFDFVVGVRHDNCLSCPASANNKTTTADTACFYSVEGAMERACTCLRGTVRLLMPSATQHASSLAVGHQLFHQLLHLHWLLPLERPPPAAAAVSTPQPRPACSTEAQQARAQPVRRVLIGASGSQVPTSCVLWGRRVALHEAPGRVGTCTNNASQHVAVTLLAATAITVSVCALPGVAA